MLKRLITLISFHTDDGMALPRPIGPLIGLACPATCGRKIFLPSIRLLCFGSRMAGNSTGVQDWAAG